MSRKAGGSTPKKLPRVVWSRDWSRWIEAAGSLRNRIMLTVLLYTGLRASELCDLEWRDFLFDEGLLHVRCGKGGKEAYIGLHDRAADAVRAYVEAERADIKPTDPLFVSRQGGRLSRQQLWRIVKAAGETAGLGNVWTHVTRHSTATRLYQVTGDILKVKQALRHSSSQTTEVYTHMGGDEMRQAINRM